MVVLQAFFSTGLHPEQQSPFTTPVQRGALGGAAEGKQQAQLLISLLTFHSKTINNQDSISSTPH